VPYKATARYNYDTQNRLLRIDSIWTNRFLVYRYVDNRVSERLTYVDTTLTFRETFTYDGNGQLARTIWEDKHKFRRETTYRHDAEGQLIERTSNDQTATYVTRYRWENGNMVAAVELDGTGKRSSEWSYTYDQQPNYEALLPTDPNPDVPRTRNNRISTLLEKDYTGLIDLCANPSRRRFTYRPADGLPLSWQTDGCGLSFNEFVYEPKQP
jgi:YD repeat-containing protein